MSVIQGYTQSVLLPQLRSLALSKRQGEIVLKDVSRRLESLLFHWNDQAFRRSILMLGTEEATFWEPQNASLEIRSMVVVAVRNSLIEDLGASQPYTEALESRNEQLRDDQMPWITGERPSILKQRISTLCRFSPNVICLAIYVVDFRLRGTPCHFLAVHPRMRSSANCRSWHPNRWSLQLQTGKFSISTWLLAGSIQGWTLTFWTS